MQMQKCKENSVSKIKTVSLFKIRIQKLNLEFWTQKQLRITVNFNKGKQTSRKKNVLQIINISNLINKATEGKYHNILLKPFMFSFFLCIFQIFC